MSVEEEVTCKTRTQLKSKRSFPPDKGCESLRLKPEFIAATISFFQFSIHQSGKTTPVFIFFNLNREFKKIFFFFCTLLPLNFPHQINRQNTWKPTTNNPKNPNWLGEKRFETFTWLFSEKGKSSAQVFG